MMGNPEWSKDEICSTPDSRRENTDILEAHIMSWMMDYTKQELFKMGQEAGLGVFPLNTAADVYAEEQYRYREFFQDVEHPIAGTLSTPASPTSSRLISPLFGIALHCSVSTTATCLSASLGARRRTWYISTSPA